MTKKKYSEDEKIMLEHQAAKLFMRHYEKTTGTKIRHIWHNEPIEPDVSCRINGDQLDLEIAHLYGSEQEAMQILGRQLSDKTREELRDLVKGGDVHARLLTALNRILYNKSQKTYSSDRVWLVIRNTHPAWSSSVIRRLQENIRIPNEHPFEQIWLVADFTGNSGIVKLYPSPSGEKP